MESIFFGHSYSYYVKNGFWAVVALLLFLLIISYADKIIVLKNELNKNKFINAVSTLMFRNFSQSRFGKKLNIIRLFVYFAYIQSIINGSNYHEIKNSALSICNELIKKSKEYPYYLMQFLILKGNCYFALGRIIHTQFEEEGTGDIVYAKKMYKRSIHTYLQAKSDLLANKKFNAKKIREYYLDLLICINRVSLKSNTIPK